MTCIKANFNGPLYSTPTINNINLDSVNLCNSTKLNLRNITSNQHCMPHKLLHTMCHLLCYTVYKFCHMFLPWILLLHTYIVGCVLLHSLCHCHCYILYILYVLYCNMFCAKDTAAPYFKFCHGHSLTWFHGCYCFICMYIACSTYVCCMLCTGMFRLLVLVLYILLKALPRVCMENTARGGMSRDKYSRRRSRVLYLSRDTSPSAVFFVQTSKGSALSGILYFK